MNLVEFTKIFPDSMFRQLPKWVDADIDLEGYKKSKAPINSKILSYDDIKDYDGRLGWIVPDGYVVVDIDNVIDSGKVFDILTNKKINFSLFTTRNGGHFIFKDSENKVAQVSDGTKCALGIKIDTRVANKGYIVLPHNDPDRKVSILTSKIDKIPIYLEPQRKVKPETVPDFLALKEGGRNTALFEHAKKLVDFTSMNNDEISDSIRIINNYLLSEPIGEGELKKTVLRDDVLTKKTTSKNKKDDDSLSPAEIANQIINDNIVITHNKDIYFYIGTHYKKQRDQEDIERLIITQYDPTLSAHGRQETLKFIKLKTLVAPDQVNKHWNEINVKNGILNISEKKLYPHDPNKLNTIYLPYEYKKESPDVYSKAIDSFFNIISNGNADKLAYLYEIVGNCLLKKNIFHKFFVIVGEGGTGKSTLLNLITNLLGQHNVSYLTMQDLQDPFKPWEVRGKLANLGDDLPDKPLNETDILKKLTTGEIITFNKKHGDHSAERFFGKLIFTANKYPIIKDKTSGMHRRIKLLDLGVSFTETGKDDPFFMSSLTTIDYEYLLLKSVDAIHNALKRKKFSPYSDELVHLAEYKELQSSAIAYLHDEDVLISDLHGKPIRDVYHSYVEYCKDIRRTPLMQKNFAEDVILEYPELAVKNTTFGNGKQKRRFIRK